MEATKSRTGLVYHQDYLEHRTGAHPESHERLVAVMNRLGRCGLLDEVVRIAPRAAAEGDILRVHEAGHLDRIKRAAREGDRWLDMDTAICERSYEVALLAAGGLLEALDWIMDGKIENALCLVRPPGHHATADRAMGFCLLNNVAVAARYLQEVAGLERILIVDWDLHHGNGTQDIFYEDPSVLYFSAHQSPHYPGTGSKEEVGGGRGAGFTINVPVKAGTGEADYLTMFMEALRDRAYAFSPDFVLISAGFDAHADDPLGNLNCTESGYGILTKFTLEIADTCCNGRLLSALEGGYNLDALSRSVEAHLRALLSDIESS
ncbi:MAG: histone deacetylase [Candidatus Glassbacteria bacterium]